MRPLLSPLEMQEVDRMAQQDVGLPAAVLMENAGRTAWSWLERSELMIARQKTRILILAGGGNNGGDALVIARYASAHPGVRLQVLITSGKMKELPTLQAQILRKMNIPVSTWKPGVLLNRADLVIDGILGVGFTGNLSSEYLQLFDQVENLGGVRVALDLPSGMSTSDGPVLSADYTLSLGYPKNLLFYPRNRRLAGKIVDLDIGIPPHLGNQSRYRGAMLEPKDLGGLLRPLDPTVYKNQRGHVAVVGGSLGTTGAPILSCKAAAAARAGLVTLFTPPDVYPIAAGHLVSQMVRPFHGASFDWSMYQSVVIGPGGAKDPEALDFLKTALTKSVPLVLDAAALDLLGMILKESPDISLRNAVLTPHIGEFSRLTGVAVAQLNQDPLEEVLKAAKKWETWIVLKGSTVLVVSPEGEYWICDGYNPALATAGSGDVLSGILGALLTTSADRESAVLGAVVLHQQAGSRAWETHGWFNAEQLPDAVALLLKDPGQ